MFYFTTMQRGRKVETILRYLRALLFLSWTEVEMRMDFQSRQTVSNKAFPTKLESAEGTWGVRGATMQPDEAPERTVAAAAPGQVYSLRCRQSFRPSSSAPLPSAPWAAGHAPGAPACTGSALSAVHSGTLCSCCTGDQDVRTWSGLSQGSWLLPWDSGMTSDFLCHALRSPGQSCSPPEATSLAAPWLNESISVGTSAAHSWLTIWEVLNYIVLKREGSGARWPGLESQFLLFPALCLWGKLINISISQLPHL